MVGETQSTDHSPSLTTVLSQYQKRDIYKIPYRAVCCINRHTDQVKVEIDLRDGHPLYGPDRLYIRSNDMMLSIGAFDQHTAETKSGRVNGNTME